MNERCFALKHNGACKALEMERCPNYASCQFYKPVWMHERDRDRAYGRINSLPEERQAEIAHKYYGDRMPWKRSNVE